MGSWCDQNGTYLNLKSPEKFYMICNIVGFISFAHKLKKSIKALSKRHFCLTIHEDLPLPYWLLVRYYKVLLSVKLIVWH
jgi:hypothetical protein